MSDYGKPIRNVTEERERILSRIDRTLKDLGSRTVELPEEKLPPATTEHVKQYREIRDAIENASSAIERMMDIDQRESDIKQKMKDLRSEREDLGRGLSGVYEQIGAVAFRLYQESPLIDAGYSSAFEALARYQDDVRTIENRLNQLQRNRESGKKPGILDRVKKGSKDAYLRNRLNVQENRLPRLLQITGEQLAQGDFISQVDDEELNRATEPLRSVKKRWDEIDQELQELTQESGRLVEEFNDLSGGHGLRRARSERESDIARLREELNTLFHTIGTIVEDNRTEEFAETLKDLTKLRQEVARQDELLARLHAGRQIESVSRDLNSCRRQQDRAKKDIEELQNQLSRLHEEESALEAQLQQLESERGDPEELLHL